MLAESKIIYLFVYVSDLMASRQFYEKTLEFRVLEEDSHSVKYDAGDIILGLNRAKDFGIPVSNSHDDTSLLVFHVNNIDQMRYSLEKRGIKFAGPTDRYEIGATAIFYDLDGHSFTLYEPSNEALTWPSAEKIRRILNDDGTPIIGESRQSDFNPEIHENSNSRLALGARKMVYLFLFIRNVEEALDFYQKKLGLRIIEEDPEPGVVKYDGGGIILATHLVESEPNVKAKLEDLERPKGIAPVFYVSDIRSCFDMLTKKGIQFAKDPIKSEIGITAKFDDPNGHTFYLYQPSDEAMNWPSGTKIKQILSKHL